MMTSITPPLEMTKAIDTFHEAHHQMPSSGHRYAVLSDVKATSKESTNDWREHTSNPRHRVRKAAYHDSQSPR